MKRNPEPPDFLIRAMTAIPAILLAFLIRVDPR